MKTEEEIKNCIVYYEGYIAGQENSINDYKNYLN